METWKPILGFDGYEASDEGCIRSFWSGRPARIGNVPRVLSANVSSGYPAVNIRGPNGRRPYKVHLLILLAFKGPKPIIHNTRVEARHLNDCKTDNRSCNLEWGTVNENAADAIRNGKRPRGEDSSQTLLTNSQIEEVRRLYSTGKYMHWQIASMYGVSKGAIGRYCNGLRALKITDDVVAGIKEKRSLGWSNQAIADWFKIGEVVVSEVCNNRYLKRRLRRQREDMQIIARVVSTP